MEIAKRRMAGLAVALCLALCAIAATPVAAMADTPINSLDITVNNFEAGKTVGDVTVTYNDPAGGAGLGGKATRISYHLAKGSWVDCDAAHVLDPTRFYGIEVFLYPEAGYDTAALAAGNVKVNGEAVNYFNNPCGPGSRPPGYPDSTMRVFHYMRDINQGREPIWTEFDLAGGVPAAGDHPLTFGPTVSAGCYKQGDTIPASEFAFFKDAVPVKVGFAFEGWTCALFDGNDAILKPLTDHYDFVGASFSTSLPTQGTRLLSRRSGGPIAALLPGLPR